MSSFFRPCPSLPFPFHCFMILLAPGPLPVQVFLIGLKLKENCPSMVKLQDASELSLIILSFHGDLQGVITCKRHPTPSSSSLYRTITPTMVQSFSAYLGICILSSLACCFLHVRYQVLPGWVNIQLFDANTSTAPFLHVLCSSCWHLIGSTFTFCPILTRGLESLWFHAT